MITVSVCMIVKNESNVLARCLDSLEGIWDELIIVDTGSTDNTKEIASRYTDRIYDFSWTGDFSEARNFALGKATCDYIYSADADEVLEGENRAEFIALKSCLDPQIDIVQMYYGNQLDNGTVYNSDKELRPKLFKRIRPMLFRDPIHETLAVEPVIFDSDIVITHKPESQHNGRDLFAFARLIEKNCILSPRLQGFLHRELYLAENADMIENFTGYLRQIIDSPDSGEKEIMEASCLLAKYYRLRGDYTAMFENVVRVTVMGANSEICTELGLYYLEKGDYEEAAVWFYNAYHETQPILSVHAATDIPLNGLADVQAALGDHEMESEYRQMAVDYLAQAQDAITQG